MKSMVPLILSFFLCALVFAQQKHISDFTSLDPDAQDSIFHLPLTHKFQYLIEHTDPLTQGGSMPDNLDFAGYVPVQGSSKFGYLSINSESAPGGVTILDIEFDDTTGRWVVDNSQAVDFSFPFPTVANCSGTVTPWNTIITCEEYTSIELGLGEDLNLDGYHDFGWAIEIDPATKTIINQTDGRPDKDKLWAMGNFKHENAVVHNNLRTVYQGADDTKGQGYLFKFVASNSTDLSAGELFVYKGDKQNNHAWIKLKNSNKTDQNSTLDQCDNLGATNFGGIEDVEINPIDGMVYFAVKREDYGGSEKKGVIYRFNDKDPLDETGIENFEIYAGGGVSYDGEPWGEGNDNLVFDDLGNLWVAQDGSFIRGDNNYIWVIENGHTQDNPKVKIFAKTPAGSEPTGLTFSPDYKYIFMSIQHPGSSNKAIAQKDAFDVDRLFDKDVAIVIAREENFNYLEKDPIDEIMITQHYHDENSESKWIEIKNISGAFLYDSSYYLNLYKGASFNPDSPGAPEATQAIPDMEIDEVLLFKNKETPGMPEASYLGEADQILSAVCDFEVDDVVLITSSPGNLKYNNRRDILGTTSPVTTWGQNTSLSRGGDSELPERDFDTTNWFELDLLEEVNQADKNKNIALGTHKTGSAIWNGASWDNDSPPDRTRNTEINGNYVGGQKDFAAYNLKINESGSVNFEENTDDSNKNVFVYKNLDIHKNGSLRIGDTESLILRNPETVVTGKIEKIEKSVNRNHPNDITYWSSPVQDEQIENVFDEVSPSRIFFYDQSNYVSEATYWDVWENQDVGLMIPGKGYAAEGRAGETGIHDISFTGKPNFGTVEISDIIFNNDEGNNEDLDNDFNLIGNPYPAAIDIEAFLNTNTSIEKVIDGTVYLWTHATAVSGGNFSESDYITYNFVGGVSGVENTEVTRNIGSGQGFFVRAIKSDNVIFNSSMTLPSANNQFFKGTKKKSEIEKNRLWINLKGSDKFFKQILIGFDEKATDGMDTGYDALYLRGNQPIAFYSLMDNNELSIQGFGPFDEDKVVKIGFDSELESLEMTIALDRKEGLLKDHDILLLDKDKGVLHDMNASSYTFNYEGKGAFKDRFSLLFNSTVLGVDEDTVFEDLKVYMNDQNLIIDAQSSVIQVKIYDALGRLILKEHPESTYSEINLDRIIQGGFFLVEIIDDGGKAFTRKMIKY